MSSGVKTSSGATLYCRRVAPLTEIERALREALSEVAGGVELEVNEVG